MQRAVGRNATVCSAYCLLHTAYSSNVATTSYIFGIVVSGRGAQGAAARVDTDLAAALSRRALVRRARPGGKPVSPVVVGGVSVCRIARWKPDRWRGVGPGGRAVGRL